MTVNGTSTRRVRFSKQSLELVVAVYAAIVGTVAVGWQIHREINESADLRLGGLGTSFGWLRVGDNSPIEMEVRLPIINLGAKPAILYTVHPDLLDVSPGVAGLTARHPYVNERLPLTIPAYDVRVLTIIVGFDCQCAEIGAQSSFAGTFRVELNTSSGSFEWSQVPPIVAVERVAVSTKTNAAPGSGGPKQ